jgi:hypothetical protein
MSKLIRLNSNSSSAVGTSDNFTVTFNHPIKQSESSEEKQYYLEISLVHVAVWYSWHNISSEFNNNVFKYSHNGVDWQTVTLSNGIYSISDINSHLQDIMLQNGHYEENNGQYTYPLAFIADTNVNRVKVYVKPSSNYELDLQDANGNFRNLLGFDSQIISDEGYSIAENNPDITNGLSTLDVHCSLVSGESAFSNGSSGDILYSFSPNAGESPGSHISREPARPIALSCNTNNITNINMRITDQNENRISFNGEHVTYLLRIQEKLVI